MGENNLEETNGKVSMLPEEQPTVTDVTKSNSEVINNDVVTNVDNNTEILETKVNEEVIERDIVGIYTNLQEDKNVNEDDLISLPTLPSSELLSYVNASALIKEDLYSKDINVSHSVLTNLNTLQYIVNPKLYSGFVYNKDVFKSEVDYKDKKIKFEEVNIRSSNKENAAIDKIRSITRIGKNIQVPLWNTGIRVTIMVPPINAVYDLKKKIRDLNIESDIDTGGLLFSNKKIKLYKEILTFISSYILDSTLDIPEGKSLYDFIVFEDISLLIIGISLSLYPNGNYVTIVCSKTSEIKNNVPSCNFVTNAKIDPRELVKIDTTRVTDKMLDIISRRNSGSVSVSDLEDYRKEYIKNEDFFKIVVPYESDDLIFNLTNPVISDFLERGLSWYDDLVDSLYNVGSLSLEAKKEEIDKIIELSILGVYNSYIKSIELQNEIFDDNKTLDGLLNEISQDNYLYNIYLKHILNFINYNTIANIGTNNFLCPTCNSLQKDMEEGDRFSLEYIWMDPITYFLEIMNSKLTKMQKRINN